MIRHILTPTTLMYTGKDGKPHQVSKTHVNFDEIYKLVVSPNEPTDETYEDLIALAKPIEAFTRVANAYNTVLFFDENQQLKCTVDGKEITLPTSLIASIVGVYKARGDITPFINFIRKAYKNPDQEIFQELWDFISVCGLTLTESGNFMAYKIVRNDFKSIHDGATDNTPGTIVSMDRKSVEKNRDRTCSRGLHFAAWDYLSQYSRDPSSVVVLLSISPRNVVSIPSDYDFMKGRACEYKVVRVVASAKELFQQAIFDEEEADYDDEFENEYED